MTLGALIDAGADVTAIESAVKSMGLPELSISTSEVKKFGFRAVSVLIEHPPEHAHRHLHHIHDMIDGASEVNETAKELAKSIFQEVAVAEAKVHGSTLQKVHFHEVGAIDSIADIVGTAVAMDSLGIDQVQSSSVPTGHGTITIAHGKVSVPAPATAEILKDVPLMHSDVEAELTTPTGAAILKATATRFGSIPAMKIDSIGFGAGTIDLPDQANVLRVVIGQLAEPSANDSIVEKDQVFLVEANIDDCSAEQLADCVSRLFDAGALDAYQTPCIMKKGRSGVIVSALVSPSKVEAIETVLFESSSTIGLRRQVVSRSKLPRTEELVQSNFGPVKGKRVTLPSGKTRFKPEFDELSRLASENDVSLSEVRESIGES